MDWEAANLLGGSISLVLAFCSSLDLPPVPYAACLGLQWDSMTLRALNGITTVFSAPTETSRKR